MKKSHEELVSLLEELKDVASRMNDLYEEHPELNDEVEISDIIPMSLDEWACQIPESIEKIQGGGK